MSYHTYHTYGYGFDVSDVKLPENEEEAIQRIFNLVRMANKEFQKKFFARIQGRKGDLEGILEYESVFNCMDGLAAILFDVINDVEKVEFDCCDDFDGNQYILFTERLPWNMNHLEKKLTAERVEDILNKYISVLTDVPVAFYNIEAANGG